MVVIREGKGGWPREVINVSHRERSEKLMTSLGRPVLLNPL